MSKHFNTVVASVLIASSASVVAPTANANDIKFSDVVKGNTHYDAIYSLVNRGIITGYSDGTFRPDGTLTRGQAAKILAGVLNLDTTNKAQVFSDVSSTYEHVGAINALYEKKIINGYSDGTFKPNAPLTRGQMAKIIVKAFELEESTVVDLPFTDVSSNNDFRYYIQTLLNHSITTGTTATTYSPSQAVKRGQMASFVVRAENLSLNEGIETFTVSDFSKQSITTENKTYSYGKELSNIFNDANREVLEGAYVTAKIVGGKIVEVSELTLNNSGTDNKSLVFNGENVNNVIVNADYIKLQNTTVNGNLTLTNKAVNQFNGEKLIVNGNLLVSEQEKVALASRIDIDVAADVATDKWLYINLANTKLNEVETLRNKTIFNGDSPISILKASEDARNIQLYIPVELFQVNTRNSIKIEGSSPVKSLVIEDAKNVELALSTSIGTLKVLKSVLKK